MSKKLRLIFNDVKCDADPDDIAYVTSGYAPLSVRVAELALRGEWASGWLVPGTHSLLSLAPSPGAISPFSRARRPSRLRTR